MRLPILFLCLLLLSCNASRKIASPYTSVIINDIFKDDISIRAIELHDGILSFAGSNSSFGQIDLTNNSSKVEQIIKDSLKLEFRSIAHNNRGLFIMSVGTPALLYRIGDNKTKTIVYEEAGAGVFYDAMRFWNDIEGIAIGDMVDGCLSIIITRDGGDSWTKLSCDQLPKATKGEGAFAASNTNIAVAGDLAWVATTSSRIYFSADKGRNWQILETPIINDKPTQGIYSIDFYNEKYGVAIGGDYTDPDFNESNKAITKNGGMTWELIAKGTEPNYKSCVQFIPNSKGEGLVAVGFTGISYSNDMGSTWTKLSDESLYTIRFLNETTAYAAGKGRIAKLVFK